MADGSLLGNPIRTIRERLSAQADRFIGLFKSFDINSDVCLRGREP